MLFVNNWIEISPKQKRKVDDLQYTLMPNG